ncbi:MAG: dephospho-CoA kinase [Sandaracinaceae bacterium]|nr:dephospho-CoA kinase [Sandaracinaceae bacterium]
MKVIGLTGGIASGKSTVARRFRELGVPVVDADMIARELVAPGSEALKEIVQHFGLEFLTPQGELNRAKLGEFVFSNDAARKKLESIIHPRIAQASIEKLAALSQKGFPYAIYEAALLVEGGRWKWLDGLIVVAASPEIQLARLRARDGLDEAQALARIRAQAPLEEKLKAATWVIWNDGDLDSLFVKVDALHGEILSSVNDLRKDHSLSN